MLLLRIAALLVGLCVLLLSTFAFHFALFSGEIWLDDHENQISFITNVAFTCRDTCLVSSGIGFVLIYVAFVLISFATRLPSSDH